MLMSIDDLTLYKQIGKGAFGEVYLTSKKGSSKTYATKILEKSKYMDNPKAIKYLLNEIDILKDINHPNIIKLIKIHEDQAKVYIVTEFYNGGNLSENLEKYKNENNKAFPEDIVQYIMRQIIEGMKYLHNKKIIHRGLKLDDIMIHYEDEEDKISNNIMKGKIKIIDFGFARYLKKGELSKSTLGIPLTMSPIILNKLNKNPNYKNMEYNEKVDIWSLGCIFYELLMGENPFDSNTMKELVSKVNKGDYYVPISFSKESISFLNCMLQFEPSKRLSVDKLYNHKFLRKNIKEFNKLDMNKIKNIKIINNSKIKINTFNNDEIIDNFGNGL